MPCGDNRLGKAKIIENKMLHELQKINFENQKIPSEVESAMRSLFDKYQDSLVSSAISAEERAVHWDDEKRKPKMHIGCTILALGKNLDLSQPAIYTGANNKPEKGDMLDYPSRKCGEMNVLENALGVGYPGKIQAEPTEEMEKEDLGVIVAIVTVSEAQNTREADTYNHDVVYPCKQCLTNYQFLVDKGVLSLKSVIYNARIKDGKVVAGEPITVEALFDKFKDGTEERHQSTLKDLLHTLNIALIEYKRQIEAIKTRLGNFKDDPVPPIIPGGIYKIKLDSQRDRVEAILEAKDFCLGTIMSAIKSAAEEGVVKPRILDNLGLDANLLDSKKLDLEDLKGFSDSELGRISNKYLEILAKIVEE